MRILHCIPRRSLRSRYKHKLRIFGFDLDRTQMWPLWTHCMSSSIITIFHPQTTTIRGLRQQSRSWTFRSPGFVLYHVAWTCAWNTCMDTITSYPSATNTRTITEPPSTTGGKSTMTNAIMHRSPTPSLTKSVRSSVSMTPCDFVYDSCTIWIGDFVYDSVCAIWIGDFCL